MIGERYSRSVRTCRHLVIGVLVFVGAGWIFGGIAEDIVTGDSLSIVDERVSAWFYAHSFPAAACSMLLVTNLNGIWGITLLTAAMALFLARKQARA